ncbi:two-component sensor histidine kinase [Streptomyces sp. MUM 203J]|uniref:sensor histidine kinase n=1 Tax=Streptomyces sp. MUM 203J TaxID=2791990 RepID=UPI001F03BB66|nr:histidine kinase [Streptomyces sp. MUM 203J]MCH0538119.1 two-component sensor histidine kinase [Streptomyces sp. MUM 203J]
MAVSGLAGGVLLWALGLHMQGEQHALIHTDRLMLLPLFVMAGLELIRRTRPRTALLVGTAAIVADQLTRGNIATVLMFTDLVYAAVLYGTPASARRIPVTTGLITVGVSLGFLAWWQQPEALLLGVLTGLISFAPATTGAIVRNHREAADAARLRAEQTALLAEMDRRQAVTAERARMARELHDMVAGHLSAIAIHSTAALSLDDPGTSRDALGVIRENSVEGLAEMRRLIGLLRDGTGGNGDAPAPAPTLDGLPALVRQAEAAGAAGALTFTLDAPGQNARDALPAPVELAAYRIVQESLTNALKHAAPGPVRISLRRTGHALAVHVTSVYGDTPPGPRAPGSGAGLVGMRERVALLGGEFTAGPAEGAEHTQWHVRAELPVRADDKEPSA